MPKKRERRNRLPAEIYTVRIERDAITGVVVTEDWLKDGLQHRDGAPAGISRDAITGVVINETWWQNKKLHREDGPAFILRKTDGRVYYTEWYLHGEKVLPPRRAPASRSGQSSQKPTGPSS
jgi:hypothetical protein